MYPPEHEISEALLRYIFENGGKVKARSTYGPLADHFGLSEEERGRTRDEEYGDGKS